jgi:hypothetical protein
MPRDNSEFVVTGQGDEAAQSGDASHDMEGGRSRGGTHASIAPLPSCSLGHAGHEDLTSTAEPEGGHHSADTQARLAPLPLYEIDGAGLAASDTLCPVARAVVPNRSGRRGRPPEGSQKGAAPAAADPIAGQSTDANQGCRAGGERAIVETRPSDGSRARTKQKARGQGPRDAQDSNAPSPTTESEGQCLRDAHGASAIASVVALVRSEHRKREFALDQRKRIGNATAAFVRTQMGWSLAIPEKEREAIRKRAAAVVDAVTKGKVGPDTADDAMQFGPVIMASAAAASGWDGIEDQTTKSMEKLAKQLPAYEWVKSVRGFGAVSFARIVGEAGDISVYSNPAKLWKRMGLAVMSGQRQGNPGKGATAVDWTEHGYSGRRRSISWQMADTLFRAQWRGEKEGVPAHAIGPYGEDYARKKAEYAARIEATADLPATDPAKWTPARADKAARRYMEKAVLRDLWREWRRGARCCSTPTLDTPPDAPVTDPIPDRSAKVVPTPGVLAPTDREPHPGMVA